MIRYDLRRLLPRSTIVALCLVCLGAFHTPVSAFVWPGSVSGGTTTFGGTSVGSGNLGGATFPHTVNGPVYAQSGGKVYLPGGKVMDVTAKAPLNPSAYGPALARFAGRLVPTVMVGMAIKDLLDEVGFTRTDTGFGRLDPSVCSVAPCYNWLATGWSGGTYATHSGMCTAYSAWSKANAPAGGAYFQGTPFGTADCIGQLYRKSDNTYIQDAVATGIASRVSVSPVTTYIPATEQDLADAIASQSGWPSGSKIGDAIKEAIEQGETLPVPQPTEVTGPSTLPGTSTTTQTTVRDAQGNPTGVTNVTTNTTYNFNYGPNTVTTTTVTTTTTTNPDGTTETKVDEKEDQEEPRDPCDDTPDLITCGKLDTPETEVPKTSKNLTYTPEDLGLGSGSCPSPIPVSTSRGTWSIDLAPYCSATETYVRPMVILVAMFLAYLIMTGHRFGGD